MSSSASVPASRVFLGIGLTWLVPGAGHLLLGRRGKAILYFTLITFVYFFGMWLGDFRNLNRELFPLHFYGEVLYGGATVPLMFFTQDLLLEASDAARDAVSGIGLAFSTLEVGVLYTTVAGLLNLCVMVDVYETAYPRPRADGDE